MSKLRFIVLFCVSFVFYHCAAQNFVLQETNLDIKKTTSYLSTAKRCELVMEKKAPVTSLIFSSKSTLTNNFINALSDRFSSTFSKYKLTADAMVIDRDYKNDRDKVIRFTYGILGADKNETSDYIQLIILFEASAGPPKVIDIQIKNKNDNGIITLYDKELAKLRKKPEPEKKPEVVASTSATPAKKVTTTPAKKTTSASKKSTTPAKKTATPTKSTATTKTTTPAKKPAVAPKKN